MKIALAHQNSKRSLQTNSLFCLICLQSRNPLAVLLGEVFLVFFFFFAAFAGFGSTAATGSSTTGVALATGFAFAAGFAFAFGFTSVFLSIHLLSNNPILSSH